MLTSFYAIAGYAHKLLSKPLPRHTSESSTTNENGTASNDTTESFLQPQTNNHTPLTPITNAFFEDLEQALDDPKIFLSVEQIFIERFSIFNQNNVIYHELKNAQTNSSCEDIANIIEIQCLLLRTLEQQVIRNNGKITDEDISSFINCYIAAENQIKKVTDKIAANPPTKSRENNLNTIKKLANLITKIEDRTFNPKKKPSNPKRKYSQTETQPVGENNIASSSTVLSNNTSTIFKRPRGRPPKITTAIKGAVVN